MTQVPKPSLIEQLNELYGKMESCLIASSTSLKNYAESAFNLLLPKYEQGIIGLDVEISSLKKHVDLLGYNDAHWTSLKQPNSTTKDKFKDYKHRLLSYLKTAIRILEDHEKENKSAL